MRFVDTSYEIIRDQAHRLAAEYKQRVATPHLVLAIIQTHYWPQNVPVIAEGFCQAVIKSLPSEVNTPPDTTLYAHMVLDQADDATSLLFYLFWSSWAQDDAFIRTWHQLNWAPPMKVPTPRFNPPHQGASQDRTAEANGSRRWQRSQVRDQQQREWPTQVVEVLRGIDTDLIRFVCLHAVNYSSFSVVGGIEWMEGRNVPDPTIVRVEIEPAGGETPQVWQRTAHESMRNERTQLQRTDYRFIAETPFSLNEFDTLWAVAENGQRWCLLPLHSSATD
ncbi:MAG: hypothetical protein M1294_01965 [Firmicutes bacterium]|jgi:hypothetical protein|uniref:Uncharacterized protein n=1 Tax=Sulfobacillus benefaciens TaxID=453960 RepID=A0A2T2WRK8_9FIRM|nr:hypothetical protein [Bacillota bacterium]MCL5012974.1 hypothetical protein [Bacillota bacterium]PSR24879.1 MAG: hypothetical protein C7B43_17950 [Sulfobacillus benefaciens]